MSELVGVVVCARVKSSRIPRKVLQEVGDRRAIEHLVANLKRGKYPVVLAIPSSQDDDQLAEVGKMNNIPVYRGHDGSPLHRLAAAAKENGFEHVVRITADDILIDPWLTKKQVEHHLNREADYTYCWNVPEGTVGEVIRTSKVQEIADKMPGQNVEFISYFLRLGDLKVECYNPPAEYRYQYRLTMDYPEDLTVLRILCNSIVQPMGTLDIINYMRQRRNWYLEKINRLPLVTLYTCAHDQGDYIGACFESVVNQKGDYWEYAVIDDGSSDQTSLRLLEMYSALPADKQRKVKILRNAKAVGLPAASNQALAMARGRYIIRVDSDDFLMPGALDEMIGYMRSAGDCAALFSGYYETDETGKVTREVAHNANNHPGCCLLSKREANEIKYKEGLEHFEGHEFMQRFSAVYKTAHLDKPLWFYRQHQASKSRQTGKRDRVAQELGMPGATSTSASV